MDDLTDRQRDLLEYVKAFAVDNRLRPDDVLRAFIAGHRPVDVVFHGSDETTRTSITELDLFAASWGMSTEDVDRIMAEVNRLPRAAVQ